MEELFKKNIEALSDDDIHEGLIKFSYRIGNKLFEIQISVVDKESVAKKLIEMQQ